MNRCWYIGSSTNNMLISSSKLYAVLLCCTFDRLHGHLPNMYGIDPAGKGRSLFVKSGHIVDALHNGQVTDSKGDAPSQLLSSLGYLLNLSLQAFALLHIGILTRTVHPLIQLRDALLELVKFL